MADDTVTNSDTDIKTVGADAPAPPSEPSAGMAKPDGSAAVDREVAEEPVRRHAPAARLRPSP